MRLVQEAGIKVSHDLIDWLASMKEAKQQTRAIPF